MRDFLKKLAVAAVGVALTSQAMAASIPVWPMAGAPIAPPLDPSNLFSYLNTVMGAVNQFASGYQPHNYLYNGAFLVNQRGTGIATGGTTSGPTVTANASDRWAIESNVTSATPRGQVVTSVTGTTLAPAFANALSLYRNSGALTQPVCAEQFIKSAEFTQLQGRPVILSAWLANNAVVPAGNAATFYLFTGTGTDEGLGSLRAAVGMTASPALTPALAGIATAGSYTTPALTLVSTRYSSPQIAVPATATEGIFAICWTPGAETAGTNNGIVIQGAQLEEADPNQTTAGRFERVTYAQELARDQHFYAQWADNLAATFTVPYTCTETTSGTTATCLLMLPQPQDLAAPVAAVATATSFGMTKVADGTAEACTTLAVVASTSTPQTVKLTCAASETAAVGTMHIGLYANTGAGNTLTVNSDF
jgi:hypothetical protein